MDERQQITSAFYEACTRGETVALATVVAVRGSAYRRPGARMLVSAEGQRSGQVSGGCLERDVMRQASAVMRHGAPALRLYDSLDEDLAEGFALGCNGAVLVLIEPANASVHALMRLQERCLARRCRGAVATVYASPGTTVAAIGARAVMIEGEAPRMSGVGSEPLAAALGAALASALATGRDQDWSMRTEAGTVSAFIEVIVPPPRVLIFGAGHDVVPLLSFGRALGWCMQVVAANGGFGVRERLQGADAIHVGSARDAIAALRPDGDSIALLMTHDFVRDVEAFCALAPLRPRYIGLLGPRHRAQRLLEEAQARGVQIDAALRACIHGPVGLDIGAETPAEVALSISAEIQAVLRGRLGGQARLRTQPLHEATPGARHETPLAGDAGARLCGLQRA